jgi:uncharacterized membrane protein YdfJ with MMPL/SSD domain
LEQQAMAENCVLLGKLALVIEKGKWCIILTWILAGALAGLGAMQFMAVTELTMDPPESTPAYHANLHFASALPEVATSTTFVALVSANKSQTHVLDVSGMFDFCVSLKNALNSSGKLLSFTSNATLWNDYKVEIGSSLVSKDGRTMMLEWEIHDKPMSKEASDFEQVSQAIFHEQVQRWLPHLGFIGIISTPTIANVAVADGAHSLESMDCIALPIAFAALWIMIESGRLLIIPLVNLGISLSVSFGLMYCIALFVNVESTTPMLMMSLLIAMTIDYSLFLLTRFREEMSSLCEEKADELRVLAALAAALPSTHAAQRKSFDEAAIHTALTRTLSTAGFTVFLSCFTLIICFLAVAVFPVAFISSMGLGCAISLSIVLAINLTLGPAILSAFPSFFARTVSSERLFPQCLQAMGKLLCSRRQQMHQQLGESIVRDSTGGTQGENVNSSVRMETSSKGPSCFWVWLARITTTFPANIFIIIGVVAVTAVVGRAVFHMKLTDSMAMGVPRKTNAYDTLESLHANFGVGAVMPYRLMLEPKAGGSVLDKNLWEESGELLKNFSAELPLTTPADFVFPSFARGNHIPYTVIHWCFSGHGEATEATFALCPQVHYLVDQFTDERRSVMHGMITPAFFSRWKPWSYVAEKCTRSLQSHVS